jgi:DNA-binding CsgD family transcriptional regulator
MSIYFRRLYSCLILGVFTLYSDCLNAGAVTLFEKNKIDSILFYTEAKIPSDPVGLLHQYDRLKSDCLEGSDKIGIAMCELRMTQCYYYLKYPEKVLDHADALMVKARDLNNDSLFLFTKILYARQLYDAWLCEDALRIINDGLSRTSKVNNKCTKYYLYGSLLTLKAQSFLGLKNPLSPKAQLNIHYSALRNILKSGRATCLNIPYTNIGKCYLALNQPDSALFYFILSKRIDYSFPDNLKYDYLNIGGAYFHKRMFKESAIFLDSALISVNGGVVDCEFMVNLYSLLTNISRQTNDASSVIKYEELKNKYRRYLQQQERKVIIETSASLRKEELRAYGFDREFKYFIAFMLAVFVFMFVYYLFRVVFYGNKLKDRHRESVEEIVLTHNEINLLKRKVSYTYHELIELAKKNDPLFVPVFKELYPEFHNQLIKLLPDLTVSEQKICFYLKLNFSSKEIAHYTDVTIKAIQNRKNRLRKRLGLSEATDLYRFIINIKE